MIYNKDGTPYVLPTPNPLMQKQEVGTEEEWYVVHNFREEEGKEEVLTYERQETPSAQPAVVTTTVATTTDHEPAEPEVALTEPEVISRPEPKQMENKVHCWCLPATIKQFYDELYGETKHKLTYGDKFLFEAIVVNNTETNYLLWTNIMIPSNSILYVKNNRRWWKVMSTSMQDDGGFILTCMPSNEKPSF
jgi:hypothetical protein